MLLGNALGGKTTLNNFPAVFHFIFWLNMAYFEIVFFLKTLCACWNKQNIFSKDLSKKDQYLTKKFCFFKTALYISHSKR